MGHKFNNKILKLEIKIINKFKIKLNYKIKNS